MSKSNTSVQRCEWPRNDLALLYHDHEWGLPLHDDRRWFEFLILEGAQAGLSWDTILKRRESYRAAFDGFDPEIVAGYDEEKIALLLADPGIIRNRLKIASVISNARAFLKVQQEFTSFDRYIWRFVDGIPITNQWKTHREIPPRTVESDALSKDLKRRGFSFVGTTICYALMQACGMVNDHLIHCYRHEEIRISDET